MIEKSSGRIVPPRRAVARSDAWLARQYPAG
jgi:hypothetical protein